MIPFFSSIPSRSTVVACLSIAAVCLLPTRLPAADPIAPERREDIPNGQLGLEFEGKTIAITAGVLRELQERSSQFPEQAALIEKLVANYTGTSPGGVDNVPAKLPMPTVLADKAMQGLVRLLNLTKGVDLLSAPRVTSRPGQKATIEIISEFTYPTRYTYTTDPASGKAVVKPKDFEKKNLGYTLEVEGEVAPARDLVDVRMNWKMADLDGFLRANDSQTIAPGEPREKADRPVFTTQSIETTVALPPGATLVLGSARRHVGASHELKLEEKQDEGIILVLLTVRFDKIQPLKVSQPNRKISASGAALERADVSALFPGDVSPPASPALPD